MRGNLHFYFMNEVEKSKDQNTHLGEDISL